MDNKKAEDAKEAKKFLDFIFKDRCSDCMYSIYERDDAHCLCGVREHLYDLPDTKLEACPHFVKDRLDIDDYAKLANVGPENIDSPDRKVEDETSSAINNVRNEKHLAFYKDHGEPKYHKELKTVNECFDFFTEHEKEVAETVRKIKCEATLYYLFQYIEHELADKDSTIKARTERIEKLKKLNAPQIILDTENNMLHQLIGKYKGFERLVYLAREMDAVADNCFNPYTRSKFFNILADRTCFECKYFIDGNDDEDDKCLLGFHCGSCQCGGNNMKLLDNYKSFWELKVDKMKELNKEDINDIEVINAVVKDLNAKKIASWEAEGKPIVEPEAVSPVEE